MNSITVETYNECIETKLYFKNKHNHRVDGPSTYEYMFQFGYMNLEWHIYGEWIDLIEYENY